MRKSFGMITAALGTVFTLIQGQTQNLPTPSPSNSLLPCEQSQGFQLLFDGTVANFRGNFANFKANNDVNTDIDPLWTLCAADSSICTMNTASQNIRSRLKYSDFDLRLDYRNDDDAGIFYRGLTRTAAWWGTSMEYGIDNRTGLPGKERPGSAFAFMAPAVNNYNSYASGKWNSVRIVAKGDSVEHWHNNAKVLGFKFWNARWNDSLNSTVNPSKWKGSPDFAQNTSGCKCMVPSGYFGFQGDHVTSWHIRNLRIGSGTVNLGAADCPVDVARKPPSARPGLTIAALSGSLRVSLAGLSAARAEVLGWDGKRLATATVEDGKTLVINDWKASGIGLLRVHSRNGGLSLYKVYLP